MSIWIEPQPAPQPPGLRHQLGVSPLVAEILFKRGYTTLSTARGFLNSDYYNPTPPIDLPDVKTSAETILEHIENHKSILVWGDFDVDGQTATTILVSALRLLSAQVNHYIPLRETESHGIHIKKLAEFANNVDLLLTCDTGITAHDAIAFAKQKGLTTIITDHHDLPPSLPPADIIVSSKLVPQKHGLSTLPGVGVAYKLIEYLFNLVGHQDQVTSFLDLVALGIVADVAELTGDTRYLLQLGLEILQDTPRIGLQALFEQAELDPKNINAEHIGFMVAPRLNALGRLGDANIIVDFLTTHDKTSARITALELEALNARRKLLTDQVFDGALAQIDRNPHWEGEAAFVLDHHLWPGGVIGIVASRLVDIFHKPVILITKTDARGRGSARSVAGINITQAIATQAHLLEGYGGHPMAGGLSIQVENIEAFRHGFIQAVQNQIQDKPTINQLEIDAWVTLDQLNPAFARDIYTLAPFGAGNPPVTLAARDLHVVSQKNIGRYNEHLRITVGDPRDVRQDIIWWQGSGYNLPESEFDLAFSLQPSDYQGKPGIEVTWIESRRSSNIIKEREANQIQLIDCRQTNLPEQELLNFIADEEHNTWCEAQSCPDVRCADRTELKAKKLLIVWTIPPGRLVLKQAIKDTNPATVVFFASDPELDTPLAFLQRLAGVIKYAINHRGGMVSIKVLAAALSHTEITVLTGLQWLHARGDLIVTPFNADLFQLLPGNQTKLPDLDLLEAQLKTLLSETSAFRKYYKQGDLNQLIF